VWPRIQAKDRKKKYFGGMPEGNLPKPLKDKSQKVFGFSVYFQKSRVKPGHVDQLVAIEALANAIHYEEQRIDKEKRHCIIGTSAKFPEKYIRIILLDDYTTIHNAFFDRSFKKKLGDKK
jgi:hypothetical protein